MSRRTDPLPSVRNYVFTPTMDGKGRMWSAVEGRWIPYNGSAGYREFRMRRRAIRLRKMQRMTSAEMALYTRAVRKIEAMSEAEYRRFIRSRDW